MMQRSRRNIVFAVLLLAALFLGLGTGGVFALSMGQKLPWQRGGGAGLASSLAPAASLPGTTGQAPAPAAIVPVDYTPIPPPAEMRAMWFSFLEWRTLFEDISAAVQGGSAQTAEQLFTEGIAQMFGNCKAMGLNTVITVVRPFGDALYSSQLFPWSHLMTGTQGQDPGFDPLAIMAELAHQNGLRIEAWVNPYRVQHPTNGPAALSADNPAVRSPALAKQINGEVWYDPALPEVAQLVVDGVLEILQSYPVDGIHFDDYFYPADIDEGFDAESFAQYGEGMALADFRRDNTSRLVQKVYQAVKAKSPGATFGVSVQGNTENNYTTMFADVKKWMANDGYVDYVIPQLYWGFNYRTQSGRDSYAFGNISAEWAFYPRADSVRLYGGLGAYRIGKADAAGGARTELGDGGSNDQAEWESGHNLADMVLHLRTQSAFTGFALFRYAYLFQGEDALSTSERTALTSAMAPLAGTSSAAPASTQNDPA